MRTFDVLGTVSGVGWERNGGLRRSTARSRRSWIALMGGYLPPTRSGHIRMMSALYYVYSPARRVLAFVAKHHRHSALAHLGGEFVRRLDRHGSILFGSWSLQQTRRDSLYLRWVEKMKPSNFVQGCV
jgi:hypothetical protein